MLNSVHFFSLAESLPGKERSLSSFCWMLLLQPHVSKLSEAFYWGPHGITRVHSGGDDCSLFGRTCPVQSNTDPLSIPGRCSLQVFSLLSRGQYSEVLWLVHAHITRKRQSLDTGTFPNEVHQVQFLFLIKIFQTGKGPQHKIYHLDDF